MKIWKIRNKKNGKFYLHGSSHNDEVGASFGTFAEAAGVFKSFIRGRIHPRNRWDYTAKKTIKLPVPISAVKKALDYEIVDYELVPMATHNMMYFEECIEQMMQVLDPRDIVKLRQKGILKGNDETQMDS